MPKPNKWDFYEYDIPTDVMHFMSEGDDKAEIQIRKSGDSAIEIGIILGDRKRWFPLTEDATYALVDYLTGEPILGTEYNISVSGSEDETDDEMMGYHGLGYDPRAL